MNDMRDDLRELLHRKAGDLPVDRGVPRTLAGRARRRIALNALGATLLVVALAGGAVATLRTVGSESNIQPATNAPSPSKTVAPLPASTCASATLRAEATIEGAAGLREATITITNDATTSCTLAGWPTISLSTTSGDPITSGVTVLQVGPQWKRQGSPEPAGWPAVTLRPGDSALVVVGWSNWCPQGREIPRWQLGIPGGDSFDVTGFDQAPPCNGETEPSTIEVGPFEPNPGR